MASSVSSSPRGRGLAPRVLVLLLSPLLLVVLVAAVLADDAACTGVLPPGSGGPMDQEIPAVYVPMYEQAERTFAVNRFLLASIHDQESDFGRLQAPGVTAGLNTFGCCAGPMQFNVTDGTWAAHRDAYRQGMRPTGDYPQRAARHPSVYDPFDAIMAAGHKLAAQGADLRLDSGGTRKSVFAYNHADWYVREVLERARTWSARAAYVAASTSDEGGAVRALELAAASRADTSRERLAWPTQARTVTSGHGPRGAPCSGCSSQHEGIDIAAPDGATVHAAADGIVEFRGPMSGYGNYLCLRHGPALTTCYAHLSRFAAQPVGAAVTQGEVVGYVGQTGRSTGAHLHFEVRTSGSHLGPPVDPLPYLQSGSSVSDDLGDREAGAGCAVRLPAAPDTEDNAALAWPTDGGALIGRSNVAGSTHDPAAWPHGWQSDNAVDIAVPVGTPVRAVADGQICERCGFGGTGSRASQLAGLRFTLRLEDNAVYYAHLSRLSVRPGQRVRRGEIVGLSGSANGVAHLHLAVQHGSPESLLGLYAPLVRTEA